MNEFRVNGESILRSWCTVVTVFVQLLPLISHDVRIEQGGAQSQRPPCSILVVRTCIGGRKAGAPSARRRCTISAECLHHHQRSNRTRSPECSAAADQFLDLPLDYFLVKLYTLFGHGLLSPFRMVCRDFILTESANRVFLFIQICATYSTLSLILLRIRFLLFALPQPLT